MQWNLSIVVTIINMSFKEKILDEATLEVFIYICFRMELVTLVLICQPTIVKKNTNHDQGAHIIYKMTLKMSMYFAGILIG